jgi:hypothetical protein
MRAATGTVVPVRHSRCERDRDVVAEPARARRGACRSERRGSSSYAQASLLRSRRPSQERETGVKSRYGCVDEGWTARPTRPPSLRRVGAGPGDTPGGERRKPPPPGSGTPYDCALRKTMSSNVRSRTFDGAGVRRHRRGGQRRGVESLSARIGKPHNAPAGQAMPARRERGSKLTSEEPFLRSPTTLSASRARCQGREGASTNVVAPRPTRTG